MKERLEVTGGNNSRVAAKLNTSTLPLLLTSQFRLYRVAARGSNGPFSIVGPKRLVY